MMSYKNWDRFPFVVVNASRGLILAGADDLESAEAVALLFTSGKRKHRNFKNGDSISVIDNTANYLLHSAENLYGTGAPLFKGAGGVIVRYM